MTTIPDQPPINHEAAANALIAAVRELVQSGVPGFTLSAKGRRRKISTTATLSEAFLEAVAAASASIRSWPRTEPTPAAGRPYESADTSRWQRDRWSASSLLSFELPL
jgi:hypothetical protein